MNKITKILTKKNVKKLQIFTLFFILILIPIVSLLTYKYPQFGKIGFVLWIATFIPIIKLSLNNLIFIIKKKNYLTLLTIFILIFLIFINLKNPQNISHESTQEISCSLDLYAKSNDSGFLKTCLFGYPARQYFLPMLASLFLGRNQLALNLGNSLYFFIGISIFAKGINQYIDDQKKRDLITALVLSLILHLHFVNHFLFHLFEQSIYPFCFALISVGIYLQYIKEKRIELILLTALSLQYLIFAYTPSLALFFLGIIIFLYQYLKQKSIKMHFFYLLILLTSIINLAISLNIRSDLHIISEKNNQVYLMKEEIVKIIEHFAFQKHGTPTFSGISSLFIIMILLAAITLQLGWTAFLIIMWIIVTIIIGTISQGYFFYNFDFRLHRSLVVFPVFFTLLPLFVKKYQLKYKTLLFLFTIFLGSGLFAHFRFSADNKPTGQMALEFQPFIENIKHENQLLETQNKTATIYFIENSHDQFKPLNDMLIYFSPALHSKKYKGKLSLATCQLKYNDYYVIKTDHKCFEKIMKREQTDLIGTHLNSKGEELTIFKQNETEKKQNQLF